jgi:hypothetical protein
MSAKSLTIDDTADLQVPDRGSIDELQRSRPASARMSQ